MCSSPRLKQRRYFVLVVFSFLFISLIPDEAAYRINKRNFSKQCWWLSNWGHALSFLIFVNTDILFLSVFSLLVHPSISLVSFTLSVLLYSAGVSSVCLSLHRCHSSCSLCLWYTPCCRSPCGTPSSPVSWRPPLTPLCWVSACPPQLTTWNQSSRR